MESEEVSQRNEELERRSDTRDKSTACLIRAMRDNDNYEE